MCKTPEEYAERNFKAKKAAEEQDKHLPEGHMFANYIPTFPAQQMIANRIYVLCGDRVVLLSWFNKRYNDHWDKLEKREGVLK